MSECPATQRFRNVYRWSDTTLPVDQFFIKRYTRPHEFGLANTLSKRHTCPYGFVDQYLRLIGATHRLPIPQYPLNSLKG